MSDEVRPWDMINGSPRVSEELLMRDYLFVIHALLLDH
jgi:hypothetical protein